MPGFIQTVTYSTSRIDEVMALGEAFREKRMASDDGFKPVQISICADRDTPNRYTTIIEFPSYEDAMASSNHPDTGEFAQRMGALCDGPPSFVNLDVLAQERP